MREARTIGSDLRLLPLKNFPPDCEHAHYSSPEWCKAARGNLLPQRKLSVTRRHQRFEMATAAHTVADLVECDWCQEPDATTLNAPNPR